LVQEEAYRYPKPFKQHRKKSPSPELQDGTSTGLLRQTPLTYQSHNRNQKEFMMKPSFPIRSIARFGVAILLSVAASLVSAQTFQNKPITIIVAYPAGGGTDLIARLFAEQLTPRLGRTVVVENRPGATGIIGSGYVSKAPPDGHTLLLTPGSLPYAQLVLKTPPAAGYNALDGFTPIIHVGTSPQFLVASAASGLKTLNDAVRESKTKSLSYGTAGTGGIHHIIGEVVNNSINIKLNHVPYKGVAPAVADALGGHIPLVYLSIETVLPHIASGKLVPLGVLERNRTPIAPNVPTFWEQGYQIEINTWYGLFGPKGMHPELVKTLNQNLNEILKQPDIDARIRTLGATVVGGTPEDMNRVYRETYVKFEKIIKDLNIQGD